MSEIRLISPANDSVTGPLQAYAWPPAAASGAADEPVAPIRWNDLDVVSADRSLPKPVSLAWEPLDPSGGDVLYDVFVSRSSEFDDPMVLRGLSGPNIDVIHLHVGTRYYWQVMARSGGECVAASPVWTFTTHDARPRWIFVPGITNVRDIGGWPLPGGAKVRQGVIYRSSEMSCHLEISEEGKRVLLDTLKIRTDLDLRRPEDGAWPALDESRVEWINAPVAAYGQICDDLSREGLQNIFRVFADPSKHPILFHCWGGCDRGGTVAFLLNALLGVELEHLAQDYELSSLSVWGSRLRASADFHALLDVLASFAEDEDDIESQAENFLLHIGVTAQDIEAIRRELTVKPGGP